MMNSRAIKRRRLMDAFSDKQKLLDDVDEKRDAINTLDYDSLAQIFMNLPISERIMIEEVCPKWKEACQLAWHDIKQYKCGVSIGRAYNNRLLSQSYVEKILFQCGVYLRELILSEVCNSSIMPIVSYHCKNLTKLEFVFDETLKIDDTSDYTQAFTQLEKLEYIKIQITTIKNEDSTNFPIEIINYLQEEMKEIHLFFNTWSQEKQPLFINLEKFKHLHSLTIRFCNLDNIIQGISKKSTLVYLDIRKSWVQEESLVFDELVNLQHIDLPAASPYTMNKNTPTILTSIFNTCKNLKYLEMPRNFDNQEPEISFVNSMNLVNLVHLSTCWKISKDFATKMLKYCKQLKHLTIKCATADAIEKLTNLESLECLKFHTGNKLSKETIIAISNNCKKLKHLEIPNFQLVLQSVDDDPHTVSRVLDDLSNLEHLEYLNFADCELLQGSTVIAIADKCKYLKYLNVRGHNNLTKLSYDALTKLENLQELTVGCSLAVTNDFVKKLKGLKVFNCDRCLRLTDDGIIQLIKNCPDLERLSLFHVMNITLNTIIAADLETKNRNNGIVLCIRISDAELYEAAGRIIKSQWLMTDYSDDPLSIIVTSSD